MLPSLTNLTIGRNSTDSPPVLIQGDEKNEKTSVKTKPPYSWEELEEVSGLALKVIEAQESITLKTAAAFFVVLLETESALKAGSPSSLDAMKFLQFSEYDEPTHEAVLGAFERLGRDLLSSADDQVTELAASATPAVSTSAVAVGAPPSSSDVEDRARNVVPNSDTEKSFRSAYRAQWLRAVSTVLLHDAKSPTSREDFVLKDRKSVSVMRLVQQLTTELSSTNGVNSQASLPILGAARLAGAYLTKALGVEWLAFSHEDFANEASRNHLQALSFQFDQLGSPLDACTKKAISSVLTESTRGLQLERFEEEAAKFTFNGGYTAVESVTQLAIVQHAALELISTATGMNNLDENSDTPNVGELYKDMSTLSRVWDLVLHRKDLEVSSESTAVSVLQTHLGDNKAVSMAVSAITLKEIPGGPIRFRCKRHLPRVVDGQYAYVPCVVSTSSETTEKGQRKFPLPFRIALAAAWRLMSTIYYKTNGPELFYVKDAKKVLFHEYISLCIQNDTTKTQEFVKHCAENVLRFLKAEDCNIGRKPDQTDLTDTDIKTQMKDFVAHVACTLANAEGRLPQYQSLSDIADAEDALLVKSAVEKVLSSVASATTDWGLSKTDFHAHKVFFNRYNYHEVDPTQAGAKYDESIKASLRTGLSASLFTNATISTFVDSLDMTNQAAVELFMFRYVVDMPVEFAMLLHLICLVAYNVIQKKVNSLSILTRATFDEAMATSREDTLSFVKSQALFLAQLGKASYKKASSSFYAKMNQEMPAITDDTLYAAKTNVMWYSKLATRPFFKNADAQYDPNVEWAGPQWLRYLAVVQNTFARKKEVVEEGTYTLSAYKNFWQGIFAIFSEEPSFNDRSWPERASAAQLRANSGPVSMFLATAWLLISFLFGQTAYVYNRDSFLNNPFSSSLVAAYRFIAFVTACILLPHTQLLAFIPNLWKTLRMMVAHTRYGRDSWASDLSLLLNRTYADLRISTNRDTNNWTEVDARVKEIRETSASQQSSLPRKHVGYILYYADHLLKQRRRARSPARR